MINLHRCFLLEKRQFTTKEWTTCPLNINLITFKPTEKNRSKGRHCVECETKGIGQKVSNFFPTFFTAAIVRPLEQPLIRKDAISFLSTSDYFTRINHNKQLVAGEQIAADDKNDHPPLSTLIGSLYRYKLLTAVFRLISNDLYIQTSLIINPDVHMLILEALCAIRCPIMRIDDRRKGVSFTKEVKEMKSKREQ